MRIHTFSCRYGYKPCRCVRIWQFRWQQQLYGAGQYAGRN